MVIFFLNLIAHHANVVLNNCAASLNSPGQPHTSNCFCRIQVREVNIVWPRNQVLVVRGVHKSQDMKVFQGT